MYDMYAFVCIYIIIIIIVLIIIIIIVFYNKILNILWLPTFWQEHSTLYSNEILLDK